MKKTNLKKPVTCDECPSFNQAIFCQLEKLALVDLSKHKISNIYKKGQTLFVEGNPAFGVFCISSGKIKLSKLGSSGKEALVRVIGEGEIIGHRSLFTEVSYGATATAMEDSVVCFIDKKYILDLVRTEPTVACNIIGKLGELLGASEKRVASLSQKSVRERAAETLLVLNQSFGKTDGKGHNLLEIQITREELAGIVGTATETLIRTLSEFKEEGLIADQGKRLLILSEEKLIEVANIEGR